jgi:hypothetical protein
MLSMGLLNIQLPFQLREGSSADAYAQTRCLGSSRQWKYFTDPQSKCVTGVSNMQLFSQLRERSSADAYAYTEPRIACSTGLWHIKPARRLLK